MYVCMYIDCEILHYTGAILTLLRLHALASFYLSAAAGGQERTGVGEDDAVLSVVQHDSHLHLRPLPCHYPPPHQQSTHLSPTDLVQIAEITQRDL